MILYWPALILLILAAALLVFIHIARKGRILRTQQPLPPPAEKAYLLWTDGDLTIEREVHSPFYFGNSSDSDVVLKKSTRRYEVCLFQHNRRFAFQSLEEAEVLVNGEEVPAGYLRNGDVLTISGEEFVFRCR